MTLPEPLVPATGRPVPFRPAVEEERHGSAEEYRRFSDTGDVLTVAVLRLFASAREAAGISRDHLDGDTVGAVLDQARARYGPGFEQVLASCRVWRNGEPALPDDPVDAGDEVAVLPPVSGG